MSLPAWYPKAPSRAVIATALCALTVFGASSVAVADVSQQAAQGYGLPAPGFGYQGQPSFGYGQPSFGYGQPSFGAPAPGYPGVQPASTYTVPQGYGAPAQEIQVPQVAPGYAGQIPQVAPGYAGQVPQFPGYAEPAIPGYPAPFGAPGFGPDPYGFGPAFGFGYGPFAPSEPNYAPAEPERPAAPEPASVATTPAEPATPPARTVTVEAPQATTTVSASSSDYSYEIAPATGSTYVGTSTQIDTGPATYSDPYQAIQSQQAPAPQQEYQVVSPSYTQEYESLPSYAAPAPAPAPASQAYTAAPAPAPQTYAPAPQPQAYAPAPAPAPQAYSTAPAPAPQQGTVVVGGYEYTAAPAPAPQSADYYDLSEATAAAAAAAIVAAPNQFDVAAFAVPQQAAPVGGYFVQVGAFLDRNRAVNLVNQLASGGQSAFIVPAQVRGRLYHRVRIGAGNRRDARAIRDQVRELGHYEARVVKG